MSKINYLTGDATNPTVSGEKIIAHVCNDVGGWGKGFVLAISRKWQAPETAYRCWYSDNVGFTLGEIQLVRVTDSISVCNMLGQHGIRSRANIAPIRYEALEQCLQKLGEQARATNASVHMPRIGCGLAGGLWEHIEPLIHNTLIASGIEVYVYDFR